MPFPNAQFPWATPIRPTVQQLFDLQAKYSNLSVNQKNYSSITKWSTTSYGRIVKARNTLGHDSRVFDRFVNDPKLYWTEVLQIISPAPWFDPILVAVHQYG
jgi:hypothetical protein